MIRVLLFLLTALVFPSAVQAADGPAPLATKDLLSGRFTMARHLAGFDRPLTSTGSFHLSPAKGLVWAVETPFPSLTVVTDDGISQGSATGPLTHLEGSERAAPFVTLIAAVLSGDWSALEDSFSVASEADGTEGGTGRWRATLTPRPGGVLSTQIEAIAARGRDLVETVTLRRTGGDWDAIALADQTVAPPPLPPAIAELFTRVAQGK